MEQLGFTLRRRGGDGRYRYARAPTVPEDDIHAAIHRALETVLAPECTWHTTMPAGGYELRPQAAQRLLRLGYQSGAPDIWLYWPGGVGAGEVKTTSGRLSKTRLVHGKRGSRVVVGQEETHARLRAAGVLVAVWRSVDDALASVREWRVPLRIAVAAR